jgi:hypothetical protein
MIARLTLGRQGSGGLGVPPKFSLGHSTDHLAGLLVVDHDVGVGEIDNVVWPDRAAVVWRILGTGAGIARE